MELFGGADRVGVRALLLGDRIDVRALEQAERLGSAPLVLRAGQQGCVVVFRPGAVVCFHLAPLEEAALVRELARFVEDPLPQPEHEEAEVRRVPGEPEGVEGGCIQVAAFTVDRVQVIAEVLARSVALARYEAQVRESVAAIEAWARELERTGVARRLERQLRYHLGASLLIQHATAARLEIRDKPDLLWDRPDLERLYLRLEDEYELKERDTVLERKLALVSSTAVTLLNIVANKHSNRLEWYIITLIAVEIVLSLVSMIGGLGH